VFQMYTRSLHDALPISHEPCGGTEAEAGGAFLDDEGADPLGAGFVGEAGVDEVEVGFTAVGDPPFGSGDDVAVAGGAGRGAHVGCGRSGVGLGNSDRHGLLTGEDRKSTRLNSSHVKISYAVFCLKKKMSKLST